MTHASGARTHDRALISGLAWTAIFRWAAQAISWVATGYAARVLTPGDFGLAAMASLAIGLARMVEDLGLDAVIVQDRSLQSHQISRLGGLAVLFGLTLTGIYGLLSVPIAGFFGEPVVAGLIAVLAITFVTDALQIVPRALLQRDLAFRRLAWINFLQLITQAGTLATFAALGFSYWALVFNSVVSGICVAILLNVLRPHALSWPRELKALTKPIVFGARMLVSRIAWYGYSNADSTIAGKVLGKQSLGAYQFSLSIATIPLTEVTSLISRVIPGIFSDVQGNQAALRRYYLVLTEAIAIVTLPMFTGLALVAHDAVPVLLGPQWEETIAPLQILCIVLAVNALSILVSHVLVWTGRARANMWLNILSLGVIPFCLYVGSRHGLIGLAWAWVIAFPLANLPAYVIVFRILDLSLAAIGKTLLPAATACAVMAVCVLMLSAALPAGWNHAARFATLSVSGGVIYAAMMWFTYGQRVRELHALLRGQPA